MGSVSEDEERHPLLQYCESVNPFSDLICPICWELLAGDICITCCGHLFHADCLQQWFDCSKTCPQCRVPCVIFHRITPIGVRLKATNETDCKAAPNTNPLADTFWMIVGMFLLVLCCRMTKKCFDAN